MVSIELLKISERSNQSSAYCFSAAEQKRRGGVLSWQADRQTYLVRSDGYPDAESESGEGEGVGEDLRAGVDPDKVAEGEESYG